MVLESLSVVCMCLIWLNINLFSWRSFLTIFLSLWAVITCTMLYSTVSFQLDIASRMFLTVVVYFIPILRIQTLVLFLAVKARFQGILFFDWEIYDMLWCSHYCATIPIWVFLCVNLTVTSNISYVMKGWSGISIFNHRRVDIFVPVITSDPGDHN